MRHWKLCSGIVLIITILALAVGAMSCSFVNEPSAEDIWRMCEEYNPAELGLAETWESNELTLVLTDSIDAERGLRFATKYIPNHSEIPMFWGVYHIEHPLTNETGFNTRGVLHLESPKGVYQTFRYQLLDQDHLWLQDGNDGRVYNLSRR